MTIKIYDDIWDAAQMLPERQRPAFIYAVCLYAREGLEPSKKTAWLPTFTVIKDRIKLQRKKSERGRAAANARWNADSPPEHFEDAYADAMQTHMQNECESDADACANSMQAQCECNAYASSQHLENENAEDELEVEIETPPYSPPSMRSQFQIGCLKALNEVLVSTYTTMPEKCWLTLERAQGNWSVEDVGAMVEFKRDDWAKTKYRHNLTPNFLFSPEHFEQCMHQAKMSREEVESYAEYD